MGMIVDLNLLNKSTQSNYLPLTVALFVCIIAPYLLQYSCGIKLFTLQRTFNRLTGTGNDNEDKNVNVDTKENKTEEMMAISHQQSIQQIAYVQPQSYQYAKQPSMNVTVSYQ